MRRQSPRNPKIYFLPLAGLRKVAVAREEEEEKPYLISFFKIKVCYFNVFSRCRVGYFSFLYGGWLAVTKFLLGGLKYVVHSYSH